MSERYDKRFVMALNVGGTAIPTDTTISAGSSRAETYI